VEEENKALVEISAAEQALERADNIHEMVSLRDRAAAFQLFANAQGFKDAAQKAKIFQLKAERRAGAWLERNVDHRGAVAGNELQDATRLPDGINRYESSRWQLEAALPEERFLEWVDECLSTEREISASGLRGLAKNHLRKKERNGIAALGKDLQPTERWNVYHADMQAWKAPRQYNFIITDAPYKYEYLYLYPILAKRAANEWLKDGGLLIAMCGQAYLNQIYAMFDRHLKYWWTGAYLTPGGQSAQVFPRKAMPYWKPLLIYAKGEYDGKWFGDVCKSDVNDNDKSGHDWGQSVSGMTDIIRRFANEGDYILDPFCGAGSTGVAALELGCLFDGVEIDIDNVNISKARLNDVK